MKRRIVHMLLLSTLLVTLAAGMARANPFAPPSGAPGPAGRPLPTREPDAAPTGFWPAPVQRAFAHVTTMQRTLNQSLARELRRVRETGASGALLTVAGISFVYGVLHAVGPGHGKLVVSSFLLSRDATLLGGVVLSALISLVQVLSSVALVAVLGLALGERGLGVLGRSIWIELVSYGAIVVIGLVMGWSAITGRHLHRHREHGAMIVAAGLTPCASAIILMLFALGNGVFVIGLAASVVMAVGMGLTVAIVGVLTIAGRRSLVGWTARRPRVAGVVRRGLAVTGAVLVSAIGAVFFAGAWSRLP